MSTILMSKNFTPFSSAFIVNFEQVLFAGNTSTRFFVIVYIITR